MLHQQFMICDEILEVLMISLPLSYNNYMKPGEHCLQLRIINHLYNINTFSVEVLKQNTDCEKDF